MTRTWPVLLLAVLVLSACSSPTIPGVAARVDLTEPGQGAVPVCPVGAGD